MCFAKKDEEREMTLVVIAQDEARIWIDGIAPNSALLMVHPKVVSGKRNPHHVREGETQRGHDEDKFGKEYLESISLVLVGAKEILLVTHGTGKSNGFGAFKRHLDSHHTDLAKEVVGHIEADISNMTDPELLELARDWFDAHSSQFR